MTRKERTMERIELLMYEYKDIVLDIASKLYDSGAVNLDNYSIDGYALPKVLVTAAIKTSTESFAPMDKDFKQDVKNLENI